MIEISKLTIQLSGLRNIRGNVCVALFKGPDGYPNDTAEGVKTSSFPITTNPQIVTFDDLPYGTYAIVAFHDENADSQLNTNLLGIPKEGIGFSGDPKIWKGVPAYEKVKFEFSPEQQELEIKIKYFI